MFDFNQAINVIEILDPLTVDGAAYFNWFFTLVVIWGMFCFGVNLLVRIIARS